MFFISQYRLTYWSLREDASPVGIRRPITFTYLAGDISHLPLLSVDSCLQFLHASFAVLDNWVHLSRLDIGEVVLEF